MAVLSLYALRAERPGSGPGASPTATASAVAAATPTAGVTGIPTGTLAASRSPTAEAATDRYGYVFTAERGRIVVRRERDAAPVFELAGVAPAVSSDGKRLAYWRTTPNVGATDLRVLDVADPTSDRSVFTVSDQTLGGAVVWSNDGQGLLVATYSRETVGPLGAPTRYDVLMLDLTSAPPGTRTAAAQVSGGRVYLPVAWDRPGQVAAAVVTGEGGYAIEYATWNGNAANAFAREEVRETFAGTVQASADAKLVMGLEANGNGLRVWPINDITKAETIRNPSRISNPFWRPGPTAPYEVIWTVGVPTLRVEIFRYRTDSSTTLYTGTDQSAVAVAVRPDGSGVLITQSSGGPPPPTTRVVVDVATRQATDIWTTTGGVQFLFRGVLLR